MGALVPTRRNTVIRASCQRLVSAGKPKNDAHDVHPALLADAQVAGLARDLAGRGVRHYVIQAFRSQGCGDEDLRRNAVRTRPLQEVGAELARLFEDLSVRG